MRRRTSNVCWVAAYTCRKIGRTTQRAEKKLRSRGGAVSCETADWLGTHRPRFGQWSSCGGLDVRRVVRPRRQVSRRPRATAAGVRGRSPQRLPRLGAKAPGSAFAAEKQQKTRALQTVSAAGAAPPRVRSAELGNLFSGVSRAVVATLPHQGQRQRAGGLGSEVGRLLAERRGRFARSSPLPDRGPQRPDAGSEVFPRQPRAGRTRDRRAMA